MHILKRLKPKKEVKDSDLAWYNDLHIAKIMCLIFENHLKSQLTTKSMNK